MTMMKAIKFLVLASVVGVIAGCKLAVVVVEGGEVQSIGSGTCLEGTICIHQVNDTSYTETFTAIPNSGWALERWNSGFGFFCGDSTDPACVISAEAAEGDEAIEALIASSQTFYLMPIFKLIPDTIPGDGKEWLQPVDFLDYSYDQVNAVCPSGVCSGTLPGSTVDLTGYTWASIDEVSALFNAYGVNPPFTGPFQEREDEQAGVAISKDFKTITVCFGDCPVDIAILAGMVRDPAPAGEDPYTASFSYLPDETHSVGWFNNTDGWGGGIWLWRPATTQPTMNLEDQ